MGIESLLLDTADGVAIEAELAVPDGALRGAAVLCHPHPLYGGSMHDGVPDILFRALPQRSMAAIRFNFRGVGRSGGGHDRGVGEQHDVLAAVDALAAALARHGDDGAGGGGPPLVLAGWSFGGDVSLTVADERVAGWVPVAPPLRVVAAERFEPVATDGRPKRLLVPEHDQYNPPGQAAATTAAWTRTDVVTIPGADHFVFGHGGFITEAVTGFIAELTR